MAHGESSWTRGHRTSRCSGRAGRRDHDPRVAPPAGTSDRSEGKWPSFQAACRFSKDKYTVVDAKLFKLEFLRDAELRHRPSLEPTLNGLLRLCSCFWITFGRIHPHDGGDHSPGSGTARFLDLDCAPEKARGLTEGPEAAPDVRARRPHTRTDD